MPAATLSLREAADLATVSKSTILRAVRRGALSAERTKDRGYKIQAAEALRVYPAKKNASRLHSFSNGAVLEAELSGARALIAALEDQLRDLREQRDKWCAVAEGVKLIADQRTPSEQTPNLGLAPPRPWWKRLAG